jgi:hypothetical protein
MAASPTLDKLAVIGADGAIELFDFKTRQRTGRLAQMPKSAGPIEPLLLNHALTFSPDGRWLGVLWRDAGYIVSTESGKEPIRLGQQIWAIHFTQAGRRALVCGRECWVAEEPDWKPVGEFHALPRSFAGPPVIRPLLRHSPPIRPVSTPIAAISPDGSQVALGQSFFEVERWAAESGQVVGFLSLSPNNVGSSSLVSSLNYAPDGMRLVAVLNNRDVALVGTNGAVRRLPNDWTYSPGKAVAEISNASFTPDGTELVLVAEILELSPGPFETPNQRPLRAEVQFWDVATGTMTRRLKTDGPAYFRQAWLSSDGRKLMAVQVTYDRVPRTAAERQGEHLRPSVPTIVVVSVSLLR